MDTHFYGKPNADILLVQMMDDNDLSVIGQEYAGIRELTKNTDFFLAAVKADHWNRDLSPWPAPPVFGDEDFGDGANDTLAYLTEELIPSLAGTGTSVFLGGYSLSGLFSLWAAYQTSLFRGVSAVSPSVWFPEFCEYAGTHTLQTDAVYLSLGDREEKTRNRTMARVGDSIRSIHRHLAESGTLCTLEWNPGNHFRDPALRTARGFAWLINQMRGPQV